MSEKKRIAVCMALSWDYIPSRFFLSYEAMRDYTERTGEYIFDMVIARSAWIDTMRDMCANTALEMKPDYIFWLDVDQTYPDFTARKLIKHIDDGCRVVAGVTPDRILPCNIVLKFGGKQGACRDEDFKVNRGLVKVDSMGFGGMMTHPSVFDEIDYPRFQRKWFEGNDGDYYRHGEDVVFNEKCRDAGIDVWCDTDLHYGHMALREIKVYNQE